MDQIAILDLITFVLLTIITGLFTIGRGFVEAWVAKSAEQGAVNAINRANWPEKLAQELEQARGVERQEIRFKSYGALWSNLRPLAIYGPGVVNRSTAETLSKALSDWYFSDCGRLLLTAPVREFYFALQELLRAITKDGSEWEADRSSEDPEQLFREVLQRESLTGGLDTLEKLKTLNISKWPQEARALGKT